MSTPTDDLAAREFSIVRKGYDPDEVRLFLAQVAQGLHGPVGAVPDDGEVAEAHRTIAALRDEASRLRTERNELAASIEHQRGAHEREMEEQAAGALERIGAAEARATAGPFQGAGETVARVLATAHEEAAGLVEGAEAMAMKIRDDLKVEVEATRADAARDADRVRAEAEAFATQHRAAVESDLAEATERLAVRRAEADRVTAEADAHAAAVVEGVAVRAQAEAERRVVEARAELERVRAVTAEASARLRRVQGLLAKALDAAGAPLATDAAAIDLRTHEDAGHAVAVRTPADEPVNGGLLSRPANTEPTALG